MSQKERTKSFCSLTEIRKEYFPESAETKRKEKMNGESKEFGSNLAMEILKDVERELQA